MASQTPSVGLRVGQLTSGMGTLNDGLGNYTNGVRQLNVHLIFKWFSDLYKWSRYIIRGSGSITVNPLLLRNGVSIRIRYSNTSSQLRFSTVNQFVFRSIGSWFEPLNAAIRKCFRYCQSSSGLI